MNVIERKNEQKYIRYQTLKGTFIQLSGVRSDTGAKTIHICIGMIKIMLYIYIHNSDFFRSIFFLRKSQEMEKSLPYVPCKPRILQYEMFQ